jgi:nicotinamide-nucleotide amidase
MGNSVNAEIIAIGTEILLGEITDTNSVYLAQKLRGIGVNLYYMTSVGDNEGRIAGAISVALGRADVVITCGGLGPTVDDMTRQSVANATGRGLTFHQHLLDQIAARFAGFRAPMTENNRRQAYLPDGSIIIENPVGTAPSFIVEHEGKFVISLPGVPREMKYLFENAVMPFLRERYGLSIIKARVLRTAGIGESMLDDAIGLELLEASNPTVGLAAHAGQVDVRITAKAETEAAADVMIAGFEARIRERVGDYVFGVDGETLEAALAGVLTQAGMQIATLEAGLPPTVSKRLERVVGGLLVGSERLDDPAAVRVMLHAAGLAVAGEGMRALAEAAARHMAQIAPNTVGVAVISDPSRTEDHADKDEGSAFAVCVGDVMRSRSYGFGGASEDAVRWSATWALSAAWQMLRSHGS